MVWGDLSIPCLSAFLLKLNMSLCVGFTFKPCPGVVFVDHRLAPVMSCTCPCCVLCHGALLFLHPPFMCFHPSSTCPELRTSPQGVQSEAVAALFPACQPSLSLLRFARLKWTRLRFWQADGRVGRALLSADCCFSWARARFCQGGLAPLRNCQRWLINERRQQMSLSSCFSLLKDLICVLKLFSCKVIVPPSWKWFGVIWELSWYFSVCATRLLLEPSLLFRCSFLMLTYFSVQ